MTLPFCKAVFEKYHKDFEVYVDLQSPPDVANLFYQSRSCRWIDNESETHADGNTMQSPTREPMSFGIAFTHAAWPLDRTRSAPEF